MRMNIDIAPAPGEKPDWSGCGFDRRMNEKLAAIYGEEFSCRVHQDRGTATMIEMRLPYREAKELVQAGGSECAS